RVHTTAPLDHEERRVPRRDDPPPGLLAPIDPQALRRDRLRMDRRDLIEVIPPPGAQPRNGPERIAPRPQPLRLLRPWHREHGPAGRLAAREGLKTLQRPGPPG